MLMMEKLKKVKFMMKPNLKSGGICMFREARPVWIKDHASEMNVSVCFTLEAEDLKNTALHLTAATF